MSKRFEYRSFRELEKLAKPAGDRLHRLPPGRHLHHQLVDGVIGCLCYGDAVDLKEDRRSQPPKAFVSIDQRVTLYDRLKKGRGLGPNVRVGVFTRYGYRYSPGGSAQETVISNRRWVTEEGPRQIEQIVKVEVLEDLLTRQDGSTRQRGRPSLCGRLPRLARDAARSPRSPESPGAPPPAWICRRPLRVLGAPSAPQLSVAESLP